MNLKYEPVFFTLLILMAVAVSGCTSGNVIPSNPLDTISMNDNEDEFVAFAKTNIPIMKAGANNFDQMFIVYKIGTLSADANSQKFMQQFRLEYKGIDNYIGDTYRSGISREMGGRTSTTLGKEMYHYNLKSEDLLNWREWFSNAMVGSDREYSSTGDLFTLQEIGYYLIDSYNKGDYVAANRYAGKFREFLPNYIRSLDMAANRLQEIRP